MKTELKNDWNELIVQFETKVQEWQTFRSSGNGKEKLEGFFTDLCALVQRYILLKGKHHLINLTKRELEIVGLISEGLTNEQIGKLLHITTNTVETHRANIFIKLEVKNAQELIVKAVRCGIVKF